MSQATLRDVLEELNGKLSSNTRAKLIRIARKLADEYEGEINITVAKGGSIRFITWVQREDGTTVKETD